MSDNDIKQAVRDLMDNASKAFVLSTVDEHLKPWSRYMGAFLVEGEFTLYMATYSNSRKVKDILRNPGVQLLFASEDFTKTATLAGRAYMDSSISKKKAFWEAVPSTKDYFSEHTSPEFGLIKFEAETIEYIDQSKSNDPVVVKLK